MISHHGLLKAEKKDITYIDSIGQGRVWSGEKGLKLGLVDRIGGVQDALDCAARMAKLKSYRLTEYPEPENFLDLLLKNYKQSVKTKDHPRGPGRTGCEMVPDDVRISILGRRAANPAALRIQPDSIALIINQ